MSCVSHRTVTATGVWRAGTHIYNVIKVYIDQVRDIYMLRHTLRHAPQIPKA
jgi:hypothetical protein